MRLIDADEALRLFDNDVETMKTKIEGKVPFQVGAAMVSAAKEIRTSLKETLDNTPTLDYAPVRHGEWIRQDDTYTRFMCNVCKAKNYPIKYSYCPNCGAKMDGKEDAHG